MLLWRVDESNLRVKCDLEPPRTVDLQIMASTTRRRVQYPIY